MAEKAMLPRKLWEHPDPKSTTMWRFMQGANRKRGLNMQVSLYFLIELEEGVAVEEEIYMTYDIKKPRVVGEWRAVVESAAAISALQDRAVERRGCELRDSR